MLSGRYEFQSPRGQIGGVVDHRGTYHIGEGHHRMAAAMEVYQETGNPTYVQLLVQWGLWTEVNRPPVDSRPLPSRTWWGAFRNWLGF